MEYRGRESLRKEAFATLAISLIISNHCVQKTLTRSNHNMPSKRRNSKGEKKSSSEKKQSNDKKISSDKKMNIEKKNSSKKTSSTPNPTVEDLPCEQLRARPDMSIPKTHQNIHPWAPCIYFQEKNKKTSKKHSSYLALTRHRTRVPWRQQVPIRLLE